MTRATVDRRTVLGLALAGAVSACAGRGHLAGPTSRTASSIPPPSAPSPSASSAPELKDALGELTDRMSRALADHDRAAFLTALDPSATAARTEAGRWFDAVHQVPMHVRRMVPVSGSDGWLLPKPSDPWTFAFVHQITGLDREPVEEWYGAPLVRTAGGIRLSGWGGVKDVDPGSESTYVGFYRQLWDDGPVRFGVGRHAALLTGADVDQALHRERLGHVDAAVARTRAILASVEVPVPPEPVLVVLADTEHHELLDYMGGQRTAPTSSYAGFSCALPRRDVDHQPIDDSPAASARIVVDPSAPGSVEEARALFRHESAHALLATAWGDQDPRVPWTVEGMSQWCEVDGDRAERRRILERARSAYPSQLRSVEDVDYWKGSDEQVGSSYDLAYAAFAFVAETKGLRAAVAMMRPTFPGGTGGDPYEIGGFADAAAFDRALASWLGRQV